MPAKPGVSNVRTVAPGSVNGRGGAADAALPGSASPSWGVDRLDHRMARIRTHVRSRCPVDQRACLRPGEPDGNGPRTWTGPRAVGLPPRSVAVRRELLAHVLHVQLLDLLDQV